MAGQPSIRGAMKKSGISREQILRAAARLFRDQGYAATTLRQIADATQMKAGSIYYHFDSKDQILDEVLETGLRAIFDAVVEAIDTCEAGASYHRRIELGIHAHLRALLSMGDFTSANIRIYSQLPEEIKQRHRGLRHDYGKYWDDLFTRAQEAGELRRDVKIVPLRQFVLGALNWTVEWFDTNRYSVDELADRAAKLVLEGIQSRSR